MTSQIANMMWDDLVYRVINECRRFAPPAGRGGVQLNGAVNDFIDRCYFDTQSREMRCLSPQELFFAQ